MGLAGTAAADRSRWRNSKPRSSILDGVDSASSGDRSATEPRETRILPRGNLLDESGAVVEPAIPVFLGKLDTGGRRATRLDLANWIVSPTNPLTARVVREPAWREFFGIGHFEECSTISARRGNGRRIPELLDWLAAEFMQPQWKPKDAPGTCAT